MHFTYQLSVNTESLPNSGVELWDFSRCFPIYLRSWQHFYATAGRSGRAKYQLWCGAPLQRNHFAISPHFMVWAPDGGKGHLQNWISGDSQTTAFQTCHKWIMKIETSNGNGFFIRCKNKQAFKAFDRDVRASNCQSERFVSRPYPQWSHK